MCILYLLCIYTFLNRTFLNRAERYRFHASPTQYTVVTQCTKIRKISSFFGTLGHKQSRQFYFQTYPYYLDCYLKRSITRMRCTELKILLLKTILQKWWCAIALAHLKRQDLKLTRSLPFLFFPLHITCSHKMRNELHNFISKLR